MTSLNVDTLDPPITAPRPTLVDVVDTEQGNPVTLEELRSMNGDKVPGVAPVAAGKRRTFTDEQKRAIASEYSNAPTGTGNIVLEQYGLSYGVALRWCREFGYPTPGRGGRREALPEPKPARKNAHSKPEPEPAMGADEDTTVIAVGIDPDTDDPNMIGITFADHELDILDACAFLDGVDRYELGTEDGSALRYLPDFWLPSLQAFLEIKGQEATLDERVKAQMLASATGHPVHILFGSIQPPTVRGNDAFPAPMCGTWTFWPAPGEDPADGIGEIDFVWMECTAFPSFSAYALRRQCGKVELNSIRAMSCTQWPHPMSCGCDTSTRKPGARTPRLLDAYQRAMSYRFKGLW